jgi:uncharacterized membrane protein YeaQ/YmgE (transglycosylase-associated protein family)
MTIIWTIVVGFIVGLIARAVMPGKDGMGVALTSVLGIIGAFVGTFASQVFGLHARGESAGLFLSIVGAVLVLWLYRKWWTPSTSTSHT